MATLVRSKMLGFFLIVIGLYLAVVFFTWLGQRRLLYIADPARMPPATVGLTGVAEREITAPDEARIVAWYARAKPGRKTILYFHGNAGTLAMRAERVRRFAGDGLGIFIMAYRGYNGSTGKPSESAIEGDARLVYDTLTSEGVTAQNIVLFGESLGSGVAVKLATQRQVGGVILDAPYTSMVELAAGIYPYLPVRALILDRYESDKHIKAMNAPLLILHGEEDGLIPVRMGKRLFELAKEPKRIVVFEDGNHSDLFSEHGAHEVVAKWLAKLP
jgi:fermentation-respiration switch protein FrsA (DUF1100 family)